MKTLAKEISSVGITVVAGAGTITPGTGSGWEQISGVTLSFYNETYFDLAGMSVEDKTLFFTGATTQNVVPPTSAPSVAGNRVLVVDMMTSRPLTEAELIQVSVFGNFAEPGVVLTFDQTIYMRIRYFNTDIDNQASTIMIPISDEQLGSLEPTASDRVYVYRVISITGGDGVYNFYPVRFILQATAREEPEYQYLMRLKRSYELQNQPDRD